MNAAAPAAILESYVRTADFEAHAAALELSPALWDIFALTENRTTAAEIARALGIEAEVAHLGLRELAGHHLIRKHVQSWRDYRASSPAPEMARPAVVSASAPSAPVPSAVPPAAPPIPAHHSEGRANPPGEPLVTVAPPAPPTYPPSTPVPPAPRVTATQPPREIRLTLASTSRRRPPPDEPPGLIRIALRRTPAPAPHTTPVKSEPVAAPANGWRLRPILDAIARHGGGQVTGQLLAYRVFLGIPGELLDRAGLYSLSLTADDFTIRDPEFYAALRRSVRAVAGLEVDAIAGAAPLSQP